MPHERRTSHGCLAVTAPTVTGILGLLRRAWRWLRHCVTRAGASAVHIVRGAGGRLVERWHSDTVYRRTLIAALSALTATLMPHPAAAAAIGALISDRATRPTHRREPFLDDLEDDEDDYPAPRPHRPTDPWAPRQRPWDSLD